jgi:hypothetical protein
LCASRGVPTDLAPAAPSYYRHDRICSTLAITIDEYLVARDSLIAKDLIAFDGARFQVLSLPLSPVIRPRPPLVTQDDLDTHDPATVRQLIARQFGDGR